MRFIQDIPDMIFVTILQILFYNSVKICFAQEGKSRVGLFFLTLFTNPLVCVVETLIFGGSILYYIPKNILDNDVANSALYYIIGYTAFALMFLLLTFINVGILGKVLKVTNRYPVRFLYYMFMLVTIIYVRDIGSDGSLFSVPNLGYYVAAIGTFLLTATLLCLFFKVVVPFSKLSNLDTRVNWKLYLFPLELFNALYASYTVIMLYRVESIDDVLILYIFILSTMIAWVFIWAFYVIIKNLSATNEIKELSVEIMEALAHTIDAKDEYTKGHSVRVARYSKMLAEKMGMTKDECEDVYYMGLLHDLGKIGVPNEIINSPTKLTDEQYDVIKTHPVLGFDILSEIKSRPDLVMGARWHHERYDGKGYPDGKKGDDIPLLARIISVADSYDAMTSNRSYRNYMPQEAVRSEIEKNMGTQFDPEIAKCMLSVIDEDVNYELHE